MSAPVWKQRPDETFAEYLERWHSEIATPEEIACGEELAQLDRTDTEDRECRERPSDAPDPGPARS